MSGRDSDLRSSRGFTLVELTVVIVLIGIMTALIIPEMRGTYGDAVLKAGGRDLIGVCALASSRAVSFNRVHRVHLDPRTGQFRVEQRVRSTGAVPVFAPVKGVPGCAGELDSRIMARLQPPTGSGAAAVPVEAMAEAEPVEDAGVTEGDAEGAAGQDLRFYPDGTADRGEFVLRDREGYTLALRVNPVTGRLRVVGTEVRQE